jgi:hypothetical protein
MPPTIYIDLKHYNPDAPYARSMTGVEFTIEYGQQSPRRATVSVLDTPPLSDPTQLDSFLGELQSLGEALSEAARIPRSVVWHPKPRDDTKPAQ